jgi:hypothetical protein
MPKTGRLLLDLEDVHLVILTQFRRCCCTIRKSHAEKLVCESLVGTYTAARVQLEATAEEL